MVDLPELLRDPTPPRLGLGARTRRLVQLRRFASLADRRLTRRRSIPRRRRFRLAARLRRQRAGPLDLNRGQGGRRLWHGLLFRAIRRILKREGGYLTRDRIRAFTETYQFRLQVRGGGNLFLKRLDPVREVRSVVGLQEELGAAGVDGGHPEDVFSLRVVFCHAHHARAHVYAA